MGRNYGVENKDTFHDPETFTVGFWTGASVATVLYSILVIVGLWVLGVFL